MSVITQMLQLTWYGPIIAQSAPSLAAAAPVEFDDQWYLQSTAAGINVEPAWSDYSGSGVKIAIFDQGIDFTHSDLDGNYQATGSFDTTSGAAGGGPADGDDPHGTAVAGVVGAERNGTGIVGVAYGADLISYYNPFEQSEASFAAQAERAYQAARTVDILLNPWSFGIEFFDTWSSAFSDNIRIDPFNAIAGEISDLAYNGRGGKGTIVVQAAGDNRAWGDDTNLHNMTNRPGSIVVAATDIDGVVTNYSTPGSSILVAAPGGVGTGADAILTTDRPGTDEGYHTLNDYTQQSGTAYSAAIVSGVVALMLEANPDLTVDDVQDILSLTARQTDATNPGWQFNGATGWNGGGQHYSEDYGYGLVDTTAAVRLAESWAAGRAVGGGLASFSGIGAIPDASTAGASATVSVSSSSFAFSGTVDWIEFYLNLDHEYLSDVEITITSPSGTVATFINEPGWMVLGDFNLETQGVGFNVSSAAFRGETAVGTWTITARDLSAGSVGTLGAGTLYVYGDVPTTNDLYVYTNEFGTLTDSLTSRQVLGDADGGHDVVNGAALSAAARIDLNGGASLIAGRSLSITADVIEDAFGGDGADTLTGNDLANKLQGARGNDVLSGGDGNDTLLGGAGDDWLDGGTGIDVIDGGDGHDTVRFGAGAGAATISDLGGGVTELLFADGSIRRVSNIEAFDIAGGVATAGSTGADQFTGGESGDVIALGAGNDYLAGSGGNDSLSGGDGEDWLWAGDDDDTLDGGADKDNLNGESGNDLLFAGEGNDRVTGRDGDDEIHAGNGNDWVGVWNDWGEAPELNYFPESGNDKIYGEGGDDVLSAGLGNDVVEGGIGNDYVAGEQGDDSLTGGDGFDWLWAGSGNDTLDGGAEKDNLNGEAGNDLIFAGDGNDRITGQDGDDVIHAGDGNDWVGVWNDWGEDPSLNYFPEWGNDQIFGEAGDDVLSAGYGSDTVDGGTGNDYVAGEQEDDVLSGGDGVDWLWAGSGNDTLDGGSGADVLIGEDGIDVLTGGSGADLFLYTSLSGLGDRITDFSDAEGDVIDVSYLLAAVGYSGANAWEDGWLLQRQDGDDVIYELDRDGSDFAYSAVLIAIVENNTLEEFNFGVVGRVAGVD